MIAFLEDFMHFLPQAQMSETAKSGANISSTTGQMNALPPVMAKSMLSATSKCDTSAVSV